MSNTNKKDYIKCIWGILMVPSQIKKSDEFERYELWQMIKPVETYFFCMVRSDDVKAL